MGDASDPKFACAACGREFRWKPELAGKKAKCKCGAVVAVPVEAPGAPEEVPDDPFAALEFASAEAVAKEAIAPPPPPVMPTAQTCPSCGASVLPTAVMCVNCGYNFRTGARVSGGKPLVYASPQADRGPGKIAADVYYQAAKAAWSAPLIAFSLGCCTRGVTSGSAGLGMVIGIVQLLLILAGVGLGIFSFFGIKRYGPERILVPAILGLTLNGLFIGLIVVVMVLIAGGRNMLAGAGAGNAPGGTSSSRLQTPADAAKAGEEAVSEAGWVGVLKHGSATVTFISISDSGTLSSEMLKTLSTPVSIVIIAGDNSTSGDALTIDPTGGTIHLTDGTSHPLPDMVAVLRTAKTDRDNALKTFSPPFSVPPGRELRGKVLFIPPNIDPQTIDHLTISIDNQPTKIAGRFLSAEEKQELMEAGGAR